MASPWRVLDLQEVAIVAPGERAHAVLFHGVGANPYTKSLNETDEYLCDVFVLKSRRKKVRIVSEMFALENLDYLTSVPPFAVGGGGLLSTDPAVVVSAGEE